MAKKEINEAAEKVKKAEKEKKPKSSKPSIFSRFIKAVPRFIKDFRGEIKKIVWPTGRTVLKSTGVVLVVVAVVAIVIYIIDFGLTQGVDSLGKYAADLKTETSVTSVTTTNPTTEAPTIPTTTEPSTQVSTETTTK